MQELIDRLVADAGITAEQAQKSVEVIKNFVKEKFPMLGGAVDNMLGASMGSSDDGLDG
jgi:polyhydroxyalkanoate synthesis regulator phasin